MSEKEINSKEVGKMVLEKLSDKTGKQIIIPEENLVVGKLKENFGSKLNLHTSFHAVNDEIISAAKLKW